MTGMNEDKDKKEKDQSENFKKWYDANKDKVSELLR